MTIQFESEDFSMQELLAEFKKSEFSKDISAEVKVDKSEDGYRPIDAHYLETILRDDLPKEIVIGGIMFIIGHSMDKIGKFVFSKRRIIIIFSNGAERIINYDQGDQAIVRELLSYINDGDVVRVIFKR